jgi:hypothetical protein
VHYFDSPKDRWADSRVYFTTDKKRLLLFNDSKVSDIKAKHLAEIWKQTPGLGGIYLITPNKDDSGKNLTSFKTLDKSKKLTLLGCQNLTDLIKELPDLSVPVPKTTKPRLNIFKFSDGRFQRVAVDTLPKDKNEKVICSLTTIWSTRKAKRGSQILDNRDLTTLLAKTKKVSLYGVDSNVPQARIDETFPKARKLEDLITETVATIKFDAIKYYYASQQYGWNETDLTNWKKQIKDKQSPYLNMLQRNAELEETVQKIKSDDASFYRAFVGAPSSTQIAAWLKQHPELDIVQLKGQIQKRYPLLGHISSNVYYPKPVKHITDYINLIDQQGE